MAIRLPRPSPRRFVGGYVGPRASGGTSGSVAFADLTGDPTDNAALASALATAGGGVLSRTDITSLTGGGATALDSVVTTSLATDGTVTLVINVTGLGAQIWTLQAGTDAEDAPGGIVRPDDYNGASNAKIWVRIA